MPAAPSIFPVAFSPRLASKALILAIGFVLLGLGAPSAQADDLAEANWLFKAGQHASALEQVDRHLANKPMDASGRFLKGLILSKLNKPEEAIAVFRKLTEDYPALPEPYNNLAVIHAQQKQLDKAREALEQAVRAHPGYATAHENLGDIYSMLASQAYGKASQLGTANASAQTKLTMINEFIGKTKAGGKPAEPAAVAAAATRQEASKPVSPSSADRPDETLDETIRTTVDLWLAAWSEKDVGTYLSHYASDFQIPGGKSRAAWEAERARRIDKPGRIEVKRGMLSIEAEGNDKAVVRFLQHYRSANLDTSSNKVLVLVRRDGRWLIREERSDR